jgi:hypothetical protein
MSFSKDLLVLLQSKGLPKPINCDAKAVIIVKTFSEAVQKECLVAWNSESK